MKILLMVATFANGQAITPLKENTECTNCNVVINQTTNISNESDSQNQANCSLLTGPKLKQCLAYASKDDLKRYFFALNARAARNYLNELNDTEKREFLNNFTQQEWLNWWNNLQPEAQKIIPMTLQEQHKQLDQRAVRSAYYLESCAIILTQLICSGLKWASKLLLG